MRNFSIRSTKGEHRNSSADTNVVRLEGHTKRRHKFHEFHWLEVMRKSEIREIRGGFFFGSGFGDPEKK
jgi:hypothetical protein